MHVRMSRMVRSGAITNTDRTVAVSLASEWIRL
jgi:hypothetical protein